MKITPKRYIQGFCLVVLVLGLIRAVFPEVAYNQNEKIATSAEVIADSLKPSEAIEPLEPSKAIKPLAPSSARLRAQLEEPSEAFKPHRIYSVSSFKNAFPDDNDVQMAAAVKNGVKPVRNRDEAAKRKGELVYIASNPYYYVDNLKSSIPYLVPKASVLLQDIGKNFLDSLQIKGIPLHKIIVTSVLRSEEDVEKLQKHNLNAKTNSAHRYGTTIDICYNRYKTVQDPEGRRLRQVQNDSLKWVLSEVLNDMRKNNRCYIKYEVKQGCFHLTVR